MTDDFPTDKLIDWFHEHKREMPWRSSSDPYKIWVSEIMLQQTRVDQAQPYFDRFIKRFPTVYDLAEASQQEVLKVWEGLGYYSRARHLHHAAQKVVEEYEGKLPDTYEEISDLKGIGPYTAAAVLSIAFHKPYAAVDGNIVRVLTRYFGIEEDIRSSKTRRKIQELADKLIDEDQPGDFNQALMELGALVCTPTNPTCNKCPLKAACSAFNQVKTDEIPYKSPSRSKPHHHIGVAVLLNGNDQVLVALRPDDVMLGGLWEFPGGKNKDNESIRETVKRECREELGVDIDLYQHIASIDHAYSHFKITLHAFTGRISNGKPTPKESQQIKWVPLDQLDEYPFPKANRTLINKLTDENIELQNTLDF